MRAKVSNLVVSRILKGAEIKRLRESNRASCVSAVEGADVVASSLELLPALESEEQMESCGAIQLKKKIITKIITKVQFGFFIATF